MCLSRGAKTFLLALATSKESRIVDLSHLLSAATATSPSPRSGIITLKTLRTTSTAPATRSTTRVCLLDASFTFSLIFDTSRAERVPLAAATEAHLLTRLLRLLACISSPQTNFTFSSAMLKRVDR
jgi:hypothetical protein